MVSLSFTWAKNWTVFTGLFEGPCDLATCILTNCNLSHDLRYIVIVKEISKCLFMFYTHICWHPGITEVCLSISNWVATTLPRNLKLGCYQGSARLQLQKGWFNAVILGNPLFSKWLRSDRCNTTHLILYLSVWKPCFYQSHAIVGLIMA